MDENRINNKSTNKVKRKKLDINLNKQKKININNDFKRPILTQYNSQRISIKKEEKIIYHKNNNYGENINYISNDTDRNENEENNLKNSIKYIINDEEEESNISNNENINYILDEDNNNFDINIKESIKKENKSKNNEDFKNYIEDND